MISGYRWASSKVSQFRLAVSGPRVVVLHIGRARFWDEICIFRRELVWFAREVDDPDIGLQFRGRGSQKRKKLLGEEDGRPSWC